MSLVVEPYDIMTDKNAEHAYLFLYNPGSRLRISIIQNCPCSTWYYRRGFTGLVIVRTFPETKLEIYYRGINNPQINHLFC